MSSPLQRHSAHSPPIQEQGGPPVPFGVVLEAFVRLYCVKKAWRYGEVWLVQSSHSQSHSALHYTAAWTSCVLNSEDGDVRERLASFSAASSRRYGTPNKLQSGMVSRVIACGRPEWLNDLACDPAVFSRADVIQPNSLCVAEAVPVMLEGKHCAAVLLFADEKPHTFSTTDVHVLLDYASTLAHCYLQYVNNLQEGRFGLSNDTSGTNGLQQQQQVHTAGVCADVGDGTNPLSSSAVSCDRQVGGDNHSMLNLPHDIVLPLSETSSAYFADSDFLGAC